LGSFVKGDKSLCTFWVHLLREITHFVPFGFICLKGDNSLVHPYAKCKALDNVYKVIFPMHITTVISFLSNCDLFLL
jgi:hypothetical protein